MLEHKHGGIGHQFQASVPKILSHIGFSQCWNMVCAKFHTQDMEDKSPVMRYVVPASDNPQISFGASHRLSFVHLSGCKLQDLDWLSTVCVNKQMIHH